MSFSVTFTITFSLTSLLLGAGLAMDAFSVSMANGLNEPQMSKKKLMLIAGTFSFFQFTMPMLGWICVHTIVEYFYTFQNFIPSISLLLLGYIGGKLLIEGIKNKNGEQEKASGVKKGELLLQGVATSIDALSVGFAISEYGLLSAFVCSIIIAIVTFFMSVAGVKIGKKFGMKLAGKASILGGIILIGIGLEIFIEWLIHI